MTCGEVRELLFAFLDDELDAALSIGIQRHLEHCPDCAREAETERTIEKRLAAAMERAAATAPSTHGLLRAVLTKPAGGAVRRRLRIRAWLPFGVGVAVLVLLGMLVKDSLGPPTEAVHPGDLVELLVADFDHFLVEGRPIQIASADRLEVSEWLHGKTGISVALPATKGSRCKLIGGRKCTLDGQPAAFASYEMDANPACLVVLAGDANSLAQMERVSQGGRTFWVDRCKAHSVVACLRNDLIYAAVSRTEKDKLIHFMSELE